MNANASQASGVQRSGNSPYGGVLAKRFIFFTVLSLTALLAGLLVFRTTIWGYIDHGRSEYAGTYWLQGMDRQKYEVAVYIEKPFSVPGSQKAFVYLRKQ